MAGRAASKNKFVLHRIIRLTIARMKNRIAAPERLGVWSREDTGHTAPRLCLGPRQGRRLPISRGSNRNFDHSRGRWGVRFRENKDQDFAEAQRRKANS